MPERFDVVVIGAGPGGYVAAIRAAQLGLKVACVDKNRSLGGTCLNIGCIPSKALLESSELFFLAKNRFGRHGIATQGAELDLAKMLARKSEVVKSLTDGVAFLFRKNRIASYTGAARLAGKNRVSVTGDKSTELEANAIVLATGSVPATLPALAFDGTHIVSSTEALAFENVPQHLLVIGAGYIGLELGSVWSRLGAKVTVLEFLPRILPQTDTEIATLLQRSLTKQGLEFHLDTRVTAAKKASGKVTVQAEAGGKTVEFQGDKVLVAVGRKPLTEGLGLQEAGVRIDDKTGKISVNERFETSAPGIYAIGDLIDGPMLAHKAMHEGIALAENLAGKSGHVNYHAIPSVIYTAPEVASVGWTEDQIKERGIEYRAGKFPFMANGRAKALDETEGMVKMLADAKTDRLLGMHVIGARASELIAEGALALEFSATAEDIARTCHAHPTLSEVVGESAWAAFAKPIHA